MILDTLVGISRALRLMTKTGIARSAPSTKALGASYTVDRRDDDANKQD